MTKDEDLKLALEALKIARDQIVDPEYAPIGWSVSRLDEVLANGQQALAAPVQKGAIGAEYQKSPWDGKGISMPPPEAPVAWKWHQAPVKTSWGHEMVVADLAIDKDNTASVYCERDQTAKVEAMFTPPAAQRQWVGLSHEEVMDSWDEIRDGDWAPDFYAVIEAKLKEKNT
jgi:hypothetical protein